MAKSDDEDAFLYGSEEENDQPAAKRQKTVKFSEDIKAKGVEKGSKQITETDKQEEAKEDNEDEEVEEEEEEEESSDDDIDIIIGGTESKTSTSNQVPGNDILSEMVDTEAEQQQKQDIENSNQRTTITDKSSTININANPEYEGKPLTQLDIETLKVKPWRAPGANISDYFNFGFDEITWTAYCHKQDKLRGEFNPQKIMANIMKGPGQLPPPTIQQSNTNTNQSPMNNKNNSPAPIPPQFQNMPFNFGKMPPNMPQFPMGNLPPGMSYPPPPPPPQNYHRR
ncbi:unnamed protein product [Candida verbasci]|uniref:Pre-mRNA polyadenylation factor FIP1 n=1 Tax=Candida verbasci TaxID=1227364 RepID=A0A9W4XBV9_9ASCO|nr:unnamed protein product [Candida verbasci]